MRGSTPRIIDARHWFIPLSPLALHNTTQPDTFTGVHNMSEERRKKKSGILVWAIMGFLILGLGGFGLTGAFQTTGGSTIATIGNKELSADEYLAGFQQDIRRASEQFGQNLTFQQAQALGVDQTSLRRQVTLGALANEADRLNLSVGDPAVREALVANPAFQVAGAFSEATYDLVLNQQRISRPDYEDLLRIDQTQNLISGAVSGAVGSQNTAARVLMDFIGETRTLTWAEIDGTVLTSETETPDEAAILAYYEANPAAFTIPETRKITYAALTPNMLSEGIEIDDDAILEVFTAQQDNLSTPARRILDRIVFGDLESATAANDRIAAGEASFDEIAAERGLSPNETQIGLVRATQLSTAAAALIFGSDELGVYGPVQATLGSAIFRVNVVLDETIVTLEDVQDDIRAALADEQALSLMLTKIGNIDDLIAGGASLEELADETDIQLFTIDYNENSTEEITLDQVFVAEALISEMGEERDLVELESGGILALRVDEIIPSSVMPLADARDQAIAGATSAATVDRVQAYTEELKAQVEAGADLSVTIAAIGLSANEENNVTRTSPPSGLPPLVGLELFEQVDDEVKVYLTETGALIIKINSISEFDPESENGASFLAQAEAQIGDDIADDIYILFANGVVASTDITINQPLIDQIIASIAQ